MAAGILSALTYLLICQLPLLLKKETVQPLYVKSISWVPAERI